MARLLPVVIFATSSLLVLKVGALAVSPQTLTSIAPAFAGTATAKAAKPDPVAIPPVARAMPAPVVATPVAAKLPIASVALVAAAEIPDDALTTGSTPAPKPPEPPPAPPPSPAADNRPVISPAERIVLEKLQERRQEIEKQARELELRESLLQATQKKIEERLAELKALEARMVETPAKKEEAERERLKNLVTMYETMRAKDAARIFDRLEMRVLVDLVTAMKPAKVADILAAMTPESAEKLTLELANRRPADPRAPVPMADLPKIEGKPRP